MTEPTWASGRWAVREGETDRFVRRWTEWIATTSEGVPGFRSATLLRSDADPSRFVSVSSWDHAASLAAWKRGPSFAAGLASVRELCEGFEGGDFVEVSAVRADGRSATVRYAHAGIATFDVPAETVFGYMSSGGHPHVAFKRHELVDVSGDVVTVDAEIYAPDGSTFTTTIRHVLDRPNGIETRMIGGAFDGARFTHSYEERDGRTTVDLEGEFPTMPGVSEADELAMIDGFFVAVFAEDEATLRTWSPSPPSASPVGATIP